MRRLLLIFAMALLAGALVISLIHRDAGYVLIALGHTSIETSLWFALLLLIIVAYLFVLLSQLIFSLRMLFKDSRIRRQKKLTGQGWLAFSKGQWHEAMNSLLKAAPAEGASFANYLMAARAAHEMGNWEKASLILDKAAASDPKAHVAIDLTRAELLMENRQWREAWRLLEKLKRHAPRHRLLFSMLRTVYIELRMWPALRSLIEEMRRSKMLDDEQLSRMEQEVLEHMLLDAAQNTDKDTHPLKKLQDCWALLSKKSRDNLLLFQPYVKGLADFGAEELAEELIRQRLAEAWNEELALFYGRLKGNDVQRQLASAEIWLKQHPDSAPLLLTLGRLCLRNRQWDKARFYLEGSTKQQDLAEAHIELGRLLIAQHDAERGKRHLEKGFALMRLLPSLPLP